MSPLSVPRLWARPENLTAMSLEGCRNQVVVSPYPAYVASTKVTNCFARWACGAHMYSRAGRVPVAPPCDYQRPNGRLTRFDDSSVLRCGDRPVAAKP
jgi:hypothetical protein